MRARLKATPATRKRLTPHRVLSWRVVPCLLGLTSVPDYLRAPVGVLSHRLASVSHQEANERRKGTRRKQKELVGIIDALLPEDVRAKASHNCAGERALGTEGRSLHDVLEDTVKCLRQIERTQGKGALARYHPSRRQPPPLAIDDLSLQQGFFSAHDMAVFEVELPEWVIRATNPGAKLLFGETPWGGADGQCLLNGLVYGEDVSVVESMWQAIQSEKRCSASEKGRKKRKTGSSAAGKSNGK